MLFFFQRNQCNLPITDASNRAAVTGSPYLCFFSLLFFCRSFALLTYDIGNIGFGHAYHQRQQQRLNSWRFRGEPSPRGQLLGRWAPSSPILGRRLIRSSRVKDGVAKQADERSRHAGRYWRFVQVLRRPGRRRLQKHNHRRPDTDHQPERFRVREEGL